MNVSDRTFLMHLGGKIEVHPKVPIKTRNDLSMAYTPGVARVCMAIAKDPKKSFSLTIRRNSVAVVSDGTAVLGLGDIGPEAAMPVMEGKAMLFKEFGGIDAWPICLNTKDTEEIIRIVKALEPTFGAINLEDISAPRCFEIEDRLKAEMGIPVFHDDQHGTAVVVLAALLNSLKIVKKRIEDMKIVVAGVGASGVACSKIFLNAGARNIIGVDRIGAIYKGRKQGMNFMKDWYAAHTNPFNEKGKLSDVMAGADLFLGLAGPGLITVDDLKKMAKDPLVFAMANPEPEIHPEEASAVRADHGDGPLRLPEPDQQLPGLPGDLPRGARFAGLLHQRGDEAGGGLRHRRLRGEGGALRGLHHPVDVQPEGRADGRQGGLPRRPPDQGRPPHLQGLHGNPPRLMRSIR